MWHPAGSGVSVVKDGGTNQIGAKEEARGCGALRDPSSVCSGKAMQTGSTVMMKISGGSMDRIDNDKGTAVRRQLGGHGNLAMAAPWWHKTLVRGCK
jgi:hypothetical protein